MIFYRSSNATEGIFKLWAQFYVVTILLSPC